jgi:hypothetical protein
LLDESHVWCGLETTIRIEAEHCQGDAVWGLDLYKSRR